MSILAFQRSPAMRTIAALLVMVFTLTACATSDADDPNLTPAQRQLRQQTERFNQTVATGAVVGALLGAILGAALASNNRGAGAALGAAAGAAAGGAAGYYTASRNQGYATREQAANGVIAGATRELADLQRTAAVANDVSQQNQAKIAALETQFRAGTVTAAQFRQQTESMKRDIELMRLSAQKSYEVAATMSQDGRQMGNETLTQSANQASNIGSQLNRTANQLEDALRRVPAA